MKPSEHKTVQTRILAYAHEVGWSFVSREEAEKRRAGLTQRCRLPTVRGTFRSSPPPTPSASPTG